MPRPTTVKPMTEPEENATRRPLFRLSEAAWAVRGIGVCGDLHADEARQHGPDAAGEEREGSELREHLPAGTESNNQQEDEHHQKPLNNFVFWVFQRGVFAPCGGGGVFFPFSSPAEGGTPRPRRAAAGRAAAPRPIPSHPKVFLVSPPLCSCICIRYVYFNIARKFFKKILGNFACRQLRFRVFHKVPVFWLPLFIHLGRLPLYRTPDLKSSGFFCEKCPQTAV